ncbi:uncharacterized protein P884DRAFT_267655 [Thermothelomyces heterothallicus CBS 202.75]|uniref:uncharacterized protein n=1 Tax=Thermothelomyces heterothallicus CBS 202.75 TaxID=1149848 RepID=UPI0037439946
MSKDNVVNMNEPAYAVDDDKRHDTAGKPFQTRWTEETHMALLCTMMDIVTDNGSISISKHKDQITSGMEGRGFSFTWEAVRGFHLGNFGWQVTAQDPDDQWSLEVTGVTFQMPKWEDIREDLFEAIMQVHPPINKEQQGDIVRIMREKGHDMGWNAIRYVLVGFGCISLLANFINDICLPVVIHEQVLRHTTHKATDITVTMPRTLQNWDAETHEAVLLALIEHMKPNGSDWSAVVASLRPKGYTFSEGALVTTTILCQQHPFTPWLLLPPREHSVAMSKQQPTVWDHDAHLALLQAVMAEAPPQPAQWDAILERVAKKGYCYTASAAM